MRRQERDELYSWLNELTDEQRWKIWLAYDRMYDCKGYDPTWVATSDLIPVTTPGQAAYLIGFIYDTNDIGPWQMAELEEELERDEEFKLAAWIRKFRHEHETKEEERKRYERDDELAEELADRRRRRRPRN